MTEPFHVENRLERDQRICGESLVHYRRSTNDRTTALYGANVTGLKYSMQLRRKYYMNSTEEYDWLNAQNVTIDIRGMRGTRL